MKIAMPVNQKRLGGEVSPSFGRAPYFLIYDPGTKETRYADNDAAQSSGGAGIKAAQAIADRKVDVLLTPRCGENAAEVLKAAGIRAYKTAPGSAAYNLNAFAEGELLPLYELPRGSPHQENRTI